MNKTYLIKVNDIYGISRRIREVNPSYSLYLNVKTKKYEIHDESNHVNSLCLTIAPHELNASIIRRLHISKRENMKNYFIQIEENNKKIQEKNNKNLLEKASDITHEILSYASRSNHELDRNEIKNIINKIED